LLTVASSLLAAIRNVVLNREISENGKVKHKSQIHCIDQWHYP
jgi:uncharacterized membrane protein YjgN (DUF898 family)